MMSFWSKTCNNDSENRPESFGRQAYTVCNAEHVPFANLDTTFDPHFDPHFDPYLQLQMPIENGSKQHHDGYKRPEVVPIHAMDSSKATEEVRDGVRTSPAKHFNTGTESKNDKEKKRKISETEWGPKNEELPNEKFQRYTTPEIGRIEAAAQKREVKLQAQTEEEWAQAEQKEAQNQVRNVKPTVLVDSDSCENPKYRLFIQKEKEKKKKRICAALHSCLPSTTTDEQKMQLYNISVSCFQSFKGLDGTEFEKTVQVPLSFDRIIGLQSQVTVNNGLVDMVNSDGREDFVPYLIANGPFKHGEHVPVVISHKVSLRERWKQDEGIAQHSRVFLITIAGLKTSDVSVQKLKKARAHNIHIVVPNLSEFQDNHFVTNKRPLCLTESQMWKQIHSCLSE